MPMREVKVVEWSRNVVFDGGRAGGIIEETESDRRGLPELGIGGDASPFKDDEDERRESSSVGSVSSASCSTDIVGSETCILYQTSYQLLCIPGQFRCHINTSPRAAIKMRLTRTLHSRQAPVSCRSIVPFHLLGQFLNRPKQ